MSFLLFSRTAAAYDAVQWRVNPAGATAVRATAAADVEQSQRYQLHTRVLSLPQPDECGSAACDKAAMKIA